MALFDSGTPLANVALSDTFNTWRVRTNQINTQAAGLASNNTFTGTLNTFNNTASFKGPVTAPIVTANTVNGTAANFTTLQADSIDFDGDLTVDSVAANSITSKTGGFAGTVTAPVVSANSISGGTVSGTTGSFSGPVTAPIVTANTVNGTAANFTTLQADSIDFDGDLTVDNVSANNVSSKTGAFAGPVTAPIVTANSVVATSSANLGAVGNITITGGSTDQYLQTDGAGNLSFADVAAGGGYDVCATSFCSCACPVLNLAQGNYFKVRATSNTHLDVTGDGTSVAIDYLSNCYGVLNLPDSFITDGGGANNIANLAINNRYLLQYNKVGSQWIGSVEHVTYYPTCETRYTASRGYATRNWNLPTDLSDGQQLGSLEGHPVGAFCNQYLTSMYSHGCAIGAGPQIENGRCGMRSHQNRSLTFCYKNKPYTIAPSKLQSFFCYGQQSCICHILIGCMDDAKGIVMGYDACGFACLHQTVDYFTEQGTGACSHRKMYITCAYQVANYSMECCVSSRCFPLCGQAGIFRPIAVWPSKNLLLTAELMYCCCRNARAGFKCLDLEEFVENGRYVDVGGVTCLNLNCSESFACITCFSALWGSLSVSPNVDFDKCTSAVVAFLDPTTDNTGRYINIQKLTPKPARYEYPSSGCHELFCSSSDNLSLAVGACQIFFGGYPEGAGACFNCSLGTIAMNANSEYIAVTGIGPMTFCCYLNKISFIRDCTFGTAVGGYTLIGNCCFITRYCGSQTNIPNWSWDCNGCHLVHVSCKHNNCLNSWGTSIIFSRNTTGTAYIQTYCCCWCTDPSGTGTSNCCNQWPVGGSTTTSGGGPVVGPIDISGPIHCLYSAAASTTCCSACPSNLCGLNYDTATCTWTIGTQNWLTDCGANTAPDKLFWYNCEYSNGTQCCCGRQCGQTYTLGAAVLAGRNADGSYTNPYGIHPLSNTELFTI